MFDAIAPRYDLLNHVLSAGIDRRWRAAAAVRLRQALTDRPAGNGALFRVLDLCAGTGDLAFAVRDALGPAGGARVVGTDFSMPMLRRARDKARGAGAALDILSADALRLPFRDGAFDACTVAFGLRNVVEPAAGIREMRRVLRPGGWLFILEFGNPRIPGIRQAYGFYFHRILPRIGNAVSKSEVAYAYLPRSVSTFPDRERLAAVMEAEGLEAVAFRPLTFGIAILYEGRRKAD
jgi:demethylmenaquinone methyltransferase/2-methoxy-6-polyprenyl-1,4-benzoquinol methylase